MKDMLLSAVVVALTLTVAQPVQAQDLRTQIVGTWKITRQVRKEIASGATADIFGQKPIGHIIYTKGGHVLFFIVSDNRAAPNAANPTDAERVALFRSLAGASGTYKVEGNKIIAHYDSSWHQLWTGADIATDAEISGKTLTLTNAPFKSPQDGKDVVVVTTWERIE